MSDKFQEAFLEMLLEAAVEAAPEEHRAESDRIMIGIKQLLDSASSRTIRDMSMLRSIKAWKKDKSEEAANEPPAQRRLNETLRKLLHNLEG